MLVQIEGKRGAEQVVTTSLKVAEVFNKRHDNVIHAIEKAKNTLLKIKGSEKAFIKTKYTDITGKDNPMYYLNRDAFSFVVMGFTGEQAAEWKWKYIQAFNAMEAELKRLYEEDKAKEIKRIRKDAKAQAEAHLIGKKARKALTDAIKAVLPESPSKKFAYPNYTNLTYRILFDKTAEELRQERNVPKNECLRDYFNKDEQAKIEKVENMVAGLINVGWDYGSIKKFLVENLLLRENPIMGANYPLLPRIGA